MQNTSESIEQIGFSSLELAKLGEELNNSSDILLYKADELIEKVKQFRIEKEDFENELAIDVEIIELKLLNTEELEESNLKEIEVLDESNLVQEIVDIRRIENQHMRNLDFILEEELKELAMPSEEEVLNLEYDTYEINNLDLVTSREFC